MAMKGFRYQRFSHLLRWELHSHKRHYLGLSGGVTLAFLLVQICMFKGKTDVAENVLCVEVAGIMWLVAGLFFTVVLSHVFYPLDTKNHRINYLMLPASNAEKLLVRALVYPLCAAVLCAVALLLTDGLRMLLFASAARHYGPVFPYVVGLMAEGAGEILDIAMSPREGGIHGVWIASLIVSYFTFNFSCYLLGSAFFRRHTFLKTSVSLIAFMVAIGFLMDLILWLSGMQSERVSASDALMIYLTDTLVPLFVVLFTLLTVFNVWAGCRHFTRIQIISRKLLQLKK